MPSVGIDLGTTNSSVAVSQHGKVTVIETDQGRRIASCVAFAENERLIGEPAVHQMPRNPENTLYDIKCITGRDFADRTVTKWSKHHAAQIVECNAGKPRLVVEYNKEKRPFCPEEISAMLLLNLKQTAESYLGDNVTGAVITVPGSFNNLQRQATLDAAAIAGIHVHGLINETTAVALNCSLRHEIRRKRNIVIFQIGGGTFHAAVVALEKENIRVIAADGNCNFGGENFTKDIFRRAVGRFKEENLGTDVTSSPKASCRLRLACETAKKELSHSTSTSVKIDALMDSKDFHMKISRECFRDMAKENFKAMLAYVERAMAESKLNLNEIDDVYLVGGGTRMVAFQKCFIEKFPIWKNKLRKTINVDESALEGAAAYAEMISGRQNRRTETEETTASTCHIIHDVIPFPIEVGDGNEKPERIFDRKRTIQHREISAPANGRILKVYENDGERKQLIGEIEIKKAFSNGEKIHICYNIDEDGLLQVRAPGPLKRRNLYVRRGIPKSKLEKLVSDTQNFENEEENRRSTEQALHLFERFVYDERRAVHENKTHGNRKRRRIDKLCDETRKWILSAPKLKESDVSRKKNEFQMAYQEILSSHEDEEPTSLEPVNEIGLATNIDTTIEESGLKLNEATNTENNISNAKTEHNRREEGECHSTRDLPGLIVKGDATVEMQIASMFDQSSKGRGVKNTNSVAEKDTAPFEMICGGEGNEVTDIAEKTNDVDDQNMPGHKTPEMTNGSNLNKDSTVNAIEDLGSEITGLSIKGKTGNGTQEKTTRFYRAVEPQQSHIKDTEWEILGVGEDGKPEEEAAVDTQLTPMASEFLQEIRNKNAVVEQATSVKILEEIDSSFPSGSEGGIQKQLPATTLLLPSDSVKNLPAEATFQLPVNYVMCGWDGSMESETEIVEKEGDDAEVRSHESLATEPRNELNRNNVVIQSSPPAPDQQQQSNEVAEVETGDPSGHNLATSGSNGANQTPKKKTVILVSQNKFATSPTSPTSPCGGREESRGKKRQ